MFLLEGLVLAALLFGGVWGVVHLFKGINVVLTNRATRRFEMRDDLRKALQSRDRHQLEDFLLMWSNYIDTTTRKHVEARRDELFINEK